MSLAVSEASDRLLTVVTRKAPIHHQNVLARKADPKVTFKSLAKIWENHTKAFPLLRTTLGVVLRDKGL